MKAITGYLSVLVLILSACGGGNEDDIPVALSAQASAASSVGVKRRALYVPAGADALVYANKLLDFGELNFPAYFPGHGLTKSINGFVYRYYPQTGAYLAVIDWKVYVLGGPFGPDVVYVGDLTDFIAVAQPDATLTATKLSACPNATGSTAPNFYSCMVGTLKGGQVFSPTTLCTFTVDRSGTLTLESGAEKYVITAATRATPYFTKSSYLLVIDGTSYGLYPSIDMTIQSTITGNNFFAVGGTLTVDAKSFDPRPTPTQSHSLSCSFTVMK